MMPALVAELAAGRSVSVASLFEFQFAGGTMRLWDGVRILTTADALSWLGVGKIIAVSGLSAGSALDAQPATFTMSGASDDLIALASGGAEDVTGRPCAVYFQFLSAAYVPLDTRISIWAGLMDVMSFNLPLGGSQRISISAEGLFIDRIRAPYGMLTDNDQQARWPGDTFMEFMPSLINKTTNWLRK